jgi:TPR repeat protein
MASSIWCEKQQRYTAWVLDRRTAMSGWRALLRVLLPTITAIAVLSFTPYIVGQQCHMAHDKGALKALQEKAAAGDADAQCGLGKQYEFALGIPQDNKQAVFWLQKSAEQGSIIAQVELGVVFDKLQDYAQALIWYRKAAEQGQARAEYNLGLAYQNGESVPKDMVQAIAWYRKAADQGDVAAQLNLGALYDQGAGIPQDYAQAAYWYHKAADQGLAEAQYGLGFLYLNGNGVPKDEAQGVSWMLKAAEQGEPKAQFNLGSCYINGTGIGRDMNEGYFWIFLANDRTSDSGLKGFSENALQVLAKSMNNDDIKNEQKRAKTWLDEHQMDEHQPRIAQ